MNRAWTIGGRSALAIVLVVVALVPLLTSAFFTSQVGLTTLWLGIAAVSLTFLSGYGGMVSLAQTALFGVAGLVAAKLAVDAGWNPWAAALAGILAATVVGIVFGAVASGSEGIYFLVITLAFAQVTYFYFAAVPTFGAHEGINGSAPPEFLGDPVLEPTRMYYFLLAVSVVVYLALRYVSRTAFGLALAGRARRPAADGRPRLQRAAAPHPRLRDRRARRRRSPACCRRGPTPASRPARCRWPWRSWCSPRRSSAG